MKKEDRKNIHQDLRELFVPYEIAWQLQSYHSQKAEEEGKELFNKECIAFWNHYQEIHMNYTYDEYARHLKAPMYQQVMDWFKEKHQIDITPKLYLGASTRMTYLTMVLRYKEERGFELLVNDTKHSTYYIALNKAIKEALKFI